MRTALGIFLFLMVSFFFGHVQASAQTLCSGNDRAKSVFLFIGDGMGAAQREAAELFLRTIGNSSQSGGKRLVMNRFPVRGMSTTHSFGSPVTDSAAAMTALVCGEKTRNGVIAMDASRSRKLKSIGEMAKERGMKVGIVSSVSIDDATLACMYAHQPSRNMYYEIALDLARSDFDYFAGGGFKEPRGKNGDRPDVLEECRSNGFSIVTRPEEFKKLKPGAGKVIVIDPFLDQGRSLRYEIDDGPGYTTLAEYTRKGIELLENARGFFMVIEGGKIDWACHANDAASAVYDVIGLDAAVAEAVKFYEKHPRETLILVTADHECGGMIVNHEAVKKDPSIVGRLRFQKMSYAAFNGRLRKYRNRAGQENLTLEDLLPLIKEAFGLRVISAAQRADLKKRAEKGDSRARDMLELALTAGEIGSLRQALKSTMKHGRSRTEDEGAAKLYGGHEPLTVVLTRILDRKAGIGWSTRGHTGVPVPVSALGVCSDLFGGNYDNTDVAKKLRAAMGLQKPPARKIGLVGLPSLRWTKRFVLTPISLLK